MEKKWSNNRQVNVTKRTATGTAVTRQKPSPSILFMALVWSVASLIVWLGAGASRTYAADGDWTQAFMVMAG